MTSKGAGVGVGVGVVARGCAALPCKIVLCAALALGVVLWHYRIQTRHIICTKRK